MRSEDLSAKVKIVTDSSSYPEPEVVAKYDIRVVPLRVAFGSEVFAEGVDITNEEFYQRLAKGGKLPTTSQPSVADLSKCIARWQSRDIPSCPFLFLAN